jgi:ABC-type transport system involved in cytochrome c biogenesis permease subunit
MGGFISAFFIAIAMGLIWGFFRNPHWIGILLIITGMGVFALEFGIHSWIELLRVVVFTLLLLGGFFIGIQIFPRR